MRRFHFDHIPEVNKVFSIPENKHMSRVLRMKNGDIFEASDGTGCISVLEIISIDDSEIQLVVLEKKKGTEIPLLSTAFIGEIKAIDDSIALLAEHGIQRIVPFYTERCLSKYNEQQGIKKQDRRQKLADEAIKKVGGLYSCIVEESVPFKKLESYLALFSQKILFWENENSPSQKLEDIDYTKEHAFLIGPEGGFSEKEVEQFIKWGCHCYSLGTRIYKAQNAAAAAATLLRYFTEKTEN